MIGIVRKIFFPNILKTNSLVFVKNKYESCWYTLIHFDFMKKNSLILFFYKNNKICMHLIKADITLYAHPHTHTQTYRINKH